jgi:hypothetical protein
MTDGNADLDRWSRTSGALGGEAVWWRLVWLHVGIVGCGRTGSSLATGLARLGVHRLTLIDPDRIELHNLGEMDLVTPNDVGRFKSEVIAKRLAAAQVPIQATPIAAPIMHPKARSGAARCDVLICSVDNDAARLACAPIATREHRVLVDLGTAIQFHGEPGDGCLLCRGGHLARYAEAVENLVYRRVPRALGGDTWRLQRAGSLASLNQLAVALRVQILLDLVAERLTSSTWAQVEFDDEGHLAVRYPMTGGTSGPSPCPLCARAGLGGAGPAGRDPVLL